MNSNDLMMFIISEYDKRTEFAKEFDNTCATKDKLKIISLIVNKYNCGFDEARMVCDYFIDKTPLPTTASPQKVASVTASAREQSNQPKCPICQSTNLSKITNTSKAVKIAMFGVFGMGDNGKTWKCNNCGSKF